MERLLEEMRAWARAYIRGYDTDDAQVQRHMRMKEEHTDFVVGHCRALAAHLGLSERRRILAEMIGLFHDIGRFKQFTLYRTFNDKLSVNHALLGLKEIEALPLLERLDAAEREIFNFAIANHNALAIAETADAEKLLFAQIIRDADKLDIYRVLAPTLQPPDENASYSPYFAQCLLKGEQGDYGLIRTEEDRKLVRLLWIYNVYFGWTMREIERSGYVDQILALLPQGEDTRRGAMRLKAYMAEKMQEH